MKIEMLEDDVNDNVDFEEAHYVQTLNDVVELMINYGHLKVLMDIGKRIQEIDQ